MNPVALLLLLAASDQQGRSTLEVELDGLRNARGVIQACLTQKRQRFPDCAGDPHAMRITVPAKNGRLTFAGVQAGDYALALFHDQNANGRLDTLLGIPREGFGFSRNPLVRFGAPRYDQVSIELAPGFTRLRVRLQYML